MVERILQELSRGDFDFRNYAHPADPLSNLFDEWVPYYRLKYAIAKALRAESILEIGVRFGYSAMAFLTAVPEAKFTGIDQWRELRRPARCPGVGEARCLRIRCEVSRCRYADAETFSWWQVPLDSCRWSAGWHGHFPQSAACHRAGTVGFARSLLPDARECFQSERFSPQVKRRCELCDHNPRSRRRAVICLGTHRG